MPSKVNDMRGTRVIIGLVPALYDKVEIAYPSDTTMIYTFSLEGVTIGQVTLINDCNGNLISAERTL